VRSQHRTGAADPGRRLGETHRRADLANGTERGMRRVAEEVARSEMRIGEHAVERPDRSARYAGLAQAFGPGGARLATRRVFDLFDQRRTVRDAQLVGGEARIAEQIFATQRAAA